MTNVQTTHNTLRYIYCSGALLEDMSGDLIDIEAYDALLADNARLRAALQAFDAWYDRAASLPVEPNEYAELKTAVRLARAALAESGALPLPQSDKGE